MSDTNEALKAARFRITEMIDSGQSYDAHQIAEAQEALESAVLNAAAETVYGLTLKADEGFVYRSSWISAWEEGRNEAADRLRSMAAEDPSAP